MAQQYGTVKVDFITFTSGTTGNETDITIPVSGLADIAESGINISGDITGRNITATGNLSVSGQAFFASGIETAPSISFVDDTDTGFYNAAANEVRITTSGNDRLTVDESGNVGIGTSDPNAPLNVATGAIGGTSSKEVARFECNTNGSLRGISISAPGDVNGIGKIAMENTNYPMQFWTGTTSAARVTILSSGNVGIGTNNPQHVLDVSSQNSNTDETVAAFGNQTIQGGLEIITNGNLDWGFNAKNSRSLVFETNQTERMRIDSNGKLLAGTSSARTLGFLIVPKIQVEGLNSVSDSSLSLTANRSSDLLSARLVFTKTRGSSLGSNTIVQNGDELGAIYFCGADGTDADSRGALIQAFVDGTPGSNDMPGRLVFSTTADGASSPTERMRIKSNGNVGIGTSDPRSLLDVKKVNNAGEGATIAIRNTGSGIGTSVSLYLVPNNGGGDDLLRAAAIKSRQAISGNYADLGFFTAASDTPVERMTIAPNGNVGIGTSSPVGKLDVIGIITGRVTDSSTGAELNSAGALEIWRSGANAFIDFKSSANEDYDCRIQQQNNGLAFSTGGNTFSFERLRIDSTGRLLVGTSSARTNYYNLTSFGGSFQLEGTGGGGSRLASITNNSAANDAPLFVFAKSNGAAVGSNTLVSQISGSDTGLGEISFQGNDGSEFIEAARISALVDGTPGTNDMPGRLVFSTTADGASSPTERMRISNDGQTYIVGAGTSLSLSNTAVAGTTVALIAGRHSATAGTPGSGALSFVVYTNGNVQNTNNSYGAISDVKLKENIVDANSQWDDLKALQVRNYNFKEGQTHTQIGVVAQEVELISPGLVTESPDRDDEGNDLGTVTKSVNYSVLYMKAVKALQEAMERIEALEQRLADAGL